MKLKVQAAIPLLFSFVLLAHCEHAALPELRKLDLSYSVLSPKLENGSVRVEPDTGIAGTQINVYVNPGPGFVLRDKSLRYYTAPDNYKELEKESLYRFLMPSSNIWVAAVFDPAPAGINTVTLEETPHGNIIASPLSGSSGTEVTLNVLPESGYGIKTITVSDVDGGAVPASLSPPYRFNLAGKNVIVRVEFETKSVAGLTASGREALSIGEYDAAYRYYEAAFQKDKANNHADKEAVFYSTLGKLGSILTDLQVRKIFRNINMSVIPDSLKGWVCDDDYLAGKNPDYFKWYMVYARDIGHLNDKGYYDTDAALPRLSTPQGYPSGFLNFNIVHQGSYDDPVYGKGQYRRFWDSLLFYNLISSNRNGFNDLVDDILQNIFGSTFEEAASRLDLLDYNDTVVLNQRLIDRFELERFFGGGTVQVGKAELDIIFAYLRAIKAGFAYLASYNLECDLTPLLIPGISDDDSLNEILATVFRATLDPRLLREGSAKSLAGILPLRNLLLRTRKSSVVDRSKNELASAVQKAKTAFDYYCGPSSHLSAEAKTTIAGYLWIQDGLNQLQAALANGSVFYIPEALPATGQTSWPSPAAAKYGVQTSRFFSAGVFSINKLVLTENSGRRPVFFGLDASKTNGERILGEDQFDRNTYSYSAYTFGIDTAYLKSIFVKGFEQYGDTAMFNQVAPEIVLWQGYDPDRKPTYFNRDIAEKLYDYYQR
ncbi:MAG: hypothetical protein LBD18_06765 [Treponema sp.]|jgi:hypothetical protein|nr:hypothetical protein [Treponema sp.]